MLFRFIPALFVFIGLALFFCHPTPFREPEYLQLRERMLKKYSEKIGSQKLYSDFNNDAIPDSAYVAIPQEGPDSGKVFLRFSHFIPTIELDDSYYNILYLEKVKDLNNDDIPELYFVAVKKAGCNATGFLYVSSGKKWKPEEELDLNGCHEFRQYGSYVETKSDGRYRIEYRKPNSSYDEFYEGRID